MFALSSTALVGVVLLATPADAAVQSPLPTCETGVRHVELTADAADKRHTVCIHPGLSTNLLFDSKLARVELAVRERFRVVLQGETALTLVPTEALEDGERVPVTAWFQDGAAPASATFELWVHPTQAEGQVEVTRQPRTLTSYREGEQQAQAEARQCREEKARIQAECAEQAGLTGLIAKGLGKTGVAFKMLDFDVTARPGNTLTPTRASSYRSNTERQEGGQKVVRLAMELMLRNNGETPWKPAGAVLLGPKHVELNVLGVWPKEPIAPVEKGRIVVEVEAKENEAHGTFTLKLWSQEGSAAGELFDGVTFPQDYSNHGIRH
ncbi:DUF2381 family protein [Archangium lipolyticum]|uniref:DUF2381 family protein n=1 Tax=Archangium lipolyticum TaxID=2970465 RepID=UPI00214A609A|nr:DUF2381 family protein [Archangium lipolyticum]